MYKLTVDAVDAAKYLVIAAALYFLRQLGLSIVCYTISVDNKCHNKL